MNRETFASSNNIWIKKLIEDHFEDFFYGSQLNKYKHQKLPNVNGIFYENVVNQIRFGLKILIISTFGLTPQLLQIQRFKYFQPILDSDNPSSTLLELINKKFQTLHDGKGEKNKVEDMKAFLIDLLDCCVLSDQSSTLKKILVWIRDDLATNEKFRAIFRFAWYTAEEHEDEGFIWNNRAYIHACQNNDFQMVSHFMDISFGKNQERFRPVWVDVIHVIKLFSFLVLSQRDQIRNKSISIRGAKHQEVVRLQTAPDAR